SAMQGDRENCLEAGMDDYLSKPVRLEDFRAIIEKWGPQFLQQTNSAVAPETSGTLLTAAAEAAPVPCQIDMERLREFACGDQESLRELASLYLSQTAQQLEQLEAAICAGVPEDLRRLAHSC